MTDSMRRAIGETDRRREKQVALKRRARHHPGTVIRGIDDSLATITKTGLPRPHQRRRRHRSPRIRHPGDLEVYIAKLESDMREAAKKFEFEKAVKLRDTMKDLRTKESSFS